MKRYSKNIDAIKATESLCLLEKVRQMSEERASKAPIDSTKRAPLLDLT